MKRPLNHAYVPTEVRMRAWREIPRVTTYHRLIAAAQCFDAGC